MRKKGQKIVPFLVVYKNNVEKGSRERKLVRERGIQEISSGLHNQLSMGLSLLWLGFWRSLKIARYVLEFPLAPLRFK